MPSPDTPPAQSVCDTYDERIRGGRAHRRRAGVTGGGDSLTLVRDARGRAFTKRYQLRGGRLVKNNYPNVAEVVASEVPVAGIDSLAAVLESVTAEGTAAVIRGVPGKFYPGNGHPAFRLLRPQEGQAAAQTGARVSPERIRRNKLEPDGVHRYAATL
jgi:hypothetical protein